MRLSVVTISFNVRDLIRNTIKSVYKTYKGSGLQYVVVDNASVDGSVEMLKKEFPKIDLVLSSVNTGFSKGNNLARPKVKGDVVLFLNSDTEVEGRAIAKCLEVLEQDDMVGAVGCKVVLPTGKIDYSCHRGLPTPWNTFCYWSGLSKLFPRVRLFSGYKATYLSTNESHYIECISGTFLMIRRDLLDKIGWWDEDYFWNGEDIEICYQVKKAGFKIWYEASEKILHFKGSSSGLHPTAKVKVAKEITIQSAKSAARVMNIFVSKHWRELGPTPVMMIVRLGIWLLERYRLTKIKFGLSYT